MLAYVAITSETTVKGAVGNVISLTLAGPLLMRLRRGESPKGLILPAARVIHGQIRPDDSDNGP
jgi:hypothetical protein